MFWVIVVADVDVFVYSCIITRFITLRLAYFCYKSIIQQKYVSFFTFRCSRIELDWLPSVDYFINQFVPVSFFVIIIYTVS